MPANQFLALEQLHAQDDAQCRTYGFKQGTQSYAECRFRLDQVRTQANAEAVRRNQEAWAKIGDAFKPKPTITCTHTGNMSTCRE
jgi:hypothetical protein